MNVVHVSTSDIRGGAARASYRLHVGLRCVGCESTVLVANKYSDDPSVRLFRPPTSLMSRVKRRLKREANRQAFRSYEGTRPKGLELFSSDRSEFGKAVVEALPSCDVINLHWVAGFIDYASFFSRVPERTPIAWTLHDMNPFTGGCHYICGCRTFLSACGSCPQLGSASERDLAHRIFQRKQHVLSKVSAHRLRIVTPSHWLAEEARKSALFRNFDVSVIPYGLDVETFQPRNKAAAREVLGIEPSAKVVLFVADGIDNRRKGIDLLIAALDGLETAGGLCLVSVGGGRAFLPEKLCHCPVGLVNSDRFLSFIYSAADVFVIPSREENLANTVLEAMACGTPAIGFKVGGIPDMIRPGITGLLAEAENVRDLRHCIDKLLADEPLRRTLAVNCRRVAVEEYALEVQAKRYLALYSSLTAAAKRRPAA